MRKAVLMQKCYWLLKTVHGNRITSGWFRRFLNHHPQLSLRKGDATANVRMDAINSDTIRCYYELLKDVVKNNQLIESPAQIYNVDETGMPLNPRPPKVITKEARRKFNIVQVEIGV